jgi:dihydropteroate synthase
VSRALVNGIPIGKAFPVRLMGVINCSPESFYPGSYVVTGAIRARAEEMIAHGADLIDIGARSTAPRSPPLPEKEEMARLDLALAELDGSGITISVDTTRPAVLERCFSHDIHAANDISGLADPGYVRLVSESGLPAFLMASEKVPGDSTTLDQSFAATATVVSRCMEAGINNYVLDPAIGLWTPERITNLDWELCRNFDRFLCFDRPLLGAISRKTFLAGPHNLPPEERLPASLGLTSLLIAKGADVIRTHDVPETAEVIRVGSKVVHR